MRCQSMADVLRSFRAFRGEAEEPADALLEDADLLAPPEAPASPCAPWLRREAIAAADAIDVQERRDDDHSKAWKRQQGAIANAIMRERQTRLARGRKETRGYQERSLEQEARNAVMVRFRPRAKRAQIKAGRPKVEAKAQRTPEQKERHRESMRLHMQAKRARQMAEMADAP